MSPDLSTTPTSSRRLFLAGILGLATLPACGRAPSHTEDHTASAPNGERTGNTTSVVLDSPPIQIPQNPAAEGLKLSGEPLPAPHSIELPPLNSGKKLSFYGLPLTRTEREIASIGGGPSHYPITHSPIGVFVAGNTQRGSLHEWINARRGLGPDARLYTFRVLVEQSKLNTIFLDKLWEQHKEELGSQKITRLMLSLNGTFRVRQALLIGHMVGEPEKVVFISRNDKTEGSTIYSFGRTLSTQQGDTLENLLGQAGQPSAIEFSLAPCIAMVEWEQAIAGAVALSEQLDKFDQQAGTKQAGTDGPIFQFDAAQLRQGLNISWKDRRIGDSLTLLTLLPSVSLPQANEILREKQVSGKELLNFFNNSAFRAKFNEHLTALQQEQGEKKADFKIVDTQDVKNEQVRNLLRNEHGTSGSSGGSFLFFGSASSESDLTATENETVKSHLTALRERTGVQFEQIKSTPYFRPVQASLVFNCSNEARSKLRSISSLELKKTDGFVYGPSVPVQGTDVELLSTLDPSYAPEQALLNALPETRCSDLKQVCKLIRSTNSKDALSTLQTVSVAEETLDLLQDTVIRLRRGRLGRAVEAEALRTLAQTSRETFTELMEVITAILADPQLPEPKRKVFTTANQTLSEMNRYLNV